MKLGLALHSGQQGYEIPIPLIQRAEELGYDCVASAETSGPDAMTPLAYIAGFTKKIRLMTALAHIDARTPANLAMCAQTIDFLAGRGRMMLGLGLSGPQIVEGWYGRPWGKPNIRMRDTVAICRKMFSRDTPVTHDGKEIALPYKGEGESGLAKPLRTTFADPNPHIPILLGTTTPLNVRMTGEIADGWLGFHLVPRTVKDFIPLIEEGLARRNDGKTLKDFEIHAMLNILLCDDVREGLQQPKEKIAYYAGGMGAKGMNFHKQAMIERGFEEAANRVEELFIAGRRKEAAEAVPDEYVDEDYLVGSPARIKERFKPWRDSGITTLRLSKCSIETLELIAKIAFA